MARNFPQWIVLKFGGTSVSSLANWRNIAQIARAVAFARFAELTLDDLPDRVRAYDSGRFTVSANEDVEVVTLVELERRYVQRVLTLFQGNKSRTAHALGIDRRTLYRKAEKWVEESRTGGAGSAPAS